MFGTCNTVLHVVAAYQLKNNVAFARAWVESLIHLFEVLLEQYYLVLVHCSCFGLGTASCSQRKGLATVGFSVFRRICVYRDKEVGLGIVCNCGTFDKRYLYICGACVYYFHLRVTLFYHVAQFLGDIHIYNLLFCALLAYGSRVCATMARVDNQNKLLFLLGMNVGYCYGKEQYCDNDI